MYNLFPRVKSITYLDEYFEISEELSVFFIEEKVNVFTFLSSFLNVKETSEKNAQIIFLKSLELKEEAYKIDINSQKIVIEASSDSGFFYAAVTLKQITKGKKKIQGCHLYDEADLKVRGLMIDISRNKVPTLNTIKRIIDLVSELKMNHLELYVEGFSFEYEKYKKYLKEDAYITKNEYLELEKYASDRYVDLVPNENGFGHMGEWLKKDEFKELAECPEGIFLWGGLRAPSTLNPLDEASIALVKDLYKEMLSISNSKYFNMNFDEPFELGKGKSKEKVLEKGLGNVYIDYTLKAYEEVKKYNKTPLIWMDVLLKHTELLDRLPNDMIFVDWGYDSFYSFSNNFKKLKELNQKFIAAPGTSSWCSFLGRQDEAFESINNACKATLENDGLGVILTDWGDFGHLQFLPISYPAIVYCAMLSWRYKEGEYREVKKYLNDYIFSDKEKIIADCLMDLASYNRFENSYQGNGTETFYTFMWAVYANKEENSFEYFKDKVKDKVLSLSKYQILEEFFESKIKELERSKMNCDDSDVIKDEILLSIKTVRLINKLKMAYSNELSNDEKINMLDDIIASKEYLVKERKRLWLERNKISDFDESILTISEFIEFSEKVRKILARGENYENEI